MGKELINWENGRWIGQTLEVENGVCAVPSTPEGGLEYNDEVKACLLYTSPSPRDGLLSRMPSSA